MNFEKVALPCIDALEPVISKQPLSSIMASTIRLHDNLNKLVVGTELKMQPETVVKKSSGPSSQPDRLQSQPRTLQLAVENQGSWQAIAPVWFVRQVQGGVQCCRCLRFRFGMAWLGDKRQTLDREGVECETR